MFRYESLERGRTAARVTDAARRVGATLFAAIGLAVLTGPAFAQGGWVPGAALDPVYGAPVYFARYVAPAGHGQLTVRCTVGVGVTIDAGVPLGGRLPEGLEIGGRAPAVFKFVPVEGQPAELTGEGEVRLRSDGAVIVTVEGEQALALARLFNVPATSADITIAGTTATVPLDAASTALGSVARFCPDWPEN